MLLYLAGPMSGIDDHNFPTFHQNARVLRAAGYLVYNPAERGIVYGWEWADYLRACLKELVNCDAVALLPKWSASRGARLEVHVAEELGMTCAAVEWWLAEGRRPIS